MSGGTLSSARNLTTSGSGTSVFNFNGGVLQAGANSTTFLHGLTAANVQTGGDHQHQWL